MSYEYFHAKRCLADTKIQSLLTELKISEDKQNELCLAFYDHFIVSTSTDIYLTRIKNSFSELVAKNLVGHDSQQIIQEIAENVYQHSIVFFATTKRLEEAEKKCNHLSDEIHQIKEKLNQNDALILSSEVSSLYIEYFVKPILFRSFGNASWEKFTNKMTEIENEQDNTRLKAIEGGRSIDDKELYTPLIDFLKPLQKQIPISLTEIRSLRKHRADVAHIRPGAAQGS